MWTPIHTFVQDEEGQDLIEYSLLLAFVALGAVGILTGISGNIQTLWNNVSDALSDAVTAAS